LIAAIVYTCYSCSQFCKSTSSRHGSKGGIPTGQFGNGNEYDPYGQQQGQGPPYDNSANQQGPPYDYNGQPPPNYDYGAQKQAPPYDYRERAAY
jgi:hypothetical protein